MSEGVRSGYAPVRGARLYYDIVGAGPSLVLMHSGLADCHMWDDQVVPLARHYSVLRYDLRGFGRSAAGDLSTPDSDDLFELLRFLRLDNACVCGLSLGGLAAIDFALEHPEMVRALIPVSCGARGYRPTHKRPDVEDTLFAEAQAARERGDVARLIDLAVQMWVNGPGQPSDRAPAALRERIRTMFVANVSADTKRRKPGVVRPQDPPAIGRLHQIRTPTLVVVGECETSTIRTAADILAKEIPGARKVVMKDCAHMLNMEQSEAFNRIVLEFLRDLP